MESLPAPVLSSLLAVSAVILWELIKMIIGASRVQLARVEKSMDSLKEKLTSFETKVTSLNSRLDTQRRLIKAVYKIVKKVADENNVDVSELNGFFDN